MYDFLSLTLKEPLVIVRLTERNAKLGSGVFLGAHHSLLICMFSHEHVVPFKDPRVANSSVVL